MTSWEYQTLSIRIVHHRDRGAGYFARRTLLRDIDDDAAKALDGLGREGWELVSVIAMLHSPESPGPDYAVAFLKRPCRGGGSSGGEKA